ncbi:efflux RND transporter permease subunit [bacterium]|nr:efflux RND transporter permease subunit [bacterium]
MIDRLIRFALRQRLLTLILCFMLVGVGLFSFQRLPIDAFPDVTNVQVQILTEAEGLAPAEVERLVTYPIEIEMNGLPKVDQVRSASKFGLSVITVVFHDGVDIYFARQLIAERLNNVQSQMPEGVRPAMGPVATGMGEVFQYSVEGPLSLAERRSIQDWIVRPFLRGVPGVTEVNSLGGLLKQYQVEVRPDRLAAYGLTLHDVMSAVARNNANAAGNYLEHGDEQYLIRGLGLVDRPEELEGAVVATRQGHPVYLRDVARVVEGAAPRQGAATRDGHETVIGIVMKLKGENSREVIGRVKEKLAEANAIMPPGVKLKPFYDQLELVEKAVHTVEKALLEGGVMVVGVLLFFLWNLRSSLIVAVTIPLAMLFAFAMMKLFNLPGNLMSLGGLAIGLGMMVDAAIVMVENIFRHLSEEHGEKPLVETIYHSAIEVGRPVVFAIAIIIVVFLPLFTLQGMEGKMFSPMAFTISFAMLGSLVLALTLVPVLASFWLKGPLSEKENPLFTPVRRAYARSLDWSLRHGGWLLGGAVAALVASFALVPSLGSEFLPKMDEGSSVITASRLPSVSLAKANAQSNAVENILKQFPEVEAVVTRTGRAEVASDPMDVSQSDIFIKLKPREAWVTAKDKEALVEKMQEAVAHVPGIGLSFGEPIAVRVDEMVSGVKSQVAVKIFGEDMTVLAEKAAQVQEALQKVPGAINVKTEQTAGLAQVQIRYDRQAIARYGLAIDDLGEVVAAAIGGRVVTEIQEGQRRVGVAVRLSEQDRNDPDKLGAILVPTPTGARVPLAHLSRITVESGPAMISRENGQRRIVIEANVRGRDIGSFVADAKEALAREVTIPSGYWVTWGGQFESQQRAMATLAVVVPLVIGLIFALLFGTFGSVTQSALILLNIPFALIGGIVALFLTRQHLSVSASVGFIALFGVAVQNGVILVSTFNKLRHEGMPLEEAVREAAAVRLRPVLMTAMVASLGLVPLALSQGIGSEIQRPLAWVVIGGLFTSTALTLFLLPVLYRWLIRWRVKHPVPEPERVPVA